MLLLILMGMMAQQVGMFQSTLFTVLFVLNCILKAIQIILVLIASFIKLSD